MFKLPGVQVRKDYFNNFRMGAGQDATIYPKLFREVLEKTCNVRVKLSMTILKEKERRLDYSIFRSFLQIFLKKLKGNMKQNLLSMVLYGSVARGKAHRESDIDLLILYRKGDFDTDEAYAVSVIESRESREYQVLFEKDIYGEISPLFMTLEELSSNPLILLDIMEEGIILFERNHCFTKIVKKMRKKIKKMGSRKVSLPDGSWYWELKPEWKPGELIEVAL